MDKELKQKLPRKKKGEGADLDWWIGGDDDRLRAAEFMRKKLKNDLTIGDLYPNNMSHDNIKALKKGFWCTE